MRIIIVSACTFAAAVCLLLAWGQHRRDVKAAAATVKVLRRVPLILADRPIEKALAPSTGRPQLAVVASIDLFNPAGAVRMNQSDRSHSFS